MTIPLLRPTWAEINLGAYGRNLQKVRTQVGASVRVLAVLKADAYGHGAIRLGQYAQAKELADFFGVASVEEGISLRQAGITLPVLVLGSIYPFEAFEYAVQNDLSVTIASLDAARAVKEVSRKLGKKARCHVKQDSGMGRIGTRGAGVIQILQELHEGGAVSVEGMFTHLSSVDTDTAFTQEQLRAFTQSQEEARTRQLPVRLCHAAATPAITLLPGSYADMVRTGHGAFGLAEGYEPVLSLKSRVVFLKDVPAGASISYNRSFIAPRPMRVATLPVGYGDGYPRLLSTKADVLLGGVRCPVLGNITMDMCMVDVSAVAQVRVGSEAVLIGTQGTQQISARELAEKCSTIDYEITTRIMPRVQRIYTE